MGNARTFLFTVFATSIHAITTQVKHEDFRRHIGQLPPTDWERGLREATHQALLREHNTDPSLRDRLLEAPIIGRQDTFVPFGDITVLARGQLYSGPYGYKYIQDRYQNDCDECHNRRIRCGPFQCEGFKLQSDQDELIALWTVKRIRHRDPRYGHRYEMEYTISPIQEGITSFVTSIGGFDYNLPGHVFIEKNDVPKSIPHQLISPPIEYHSDEAPRWHNHKQNQHDNKEHHKPGILLGIDPNGYKHILHDIPNLHKINNEFAPHVHHNQHFQHNKHEYDLYRGLIESLSAKTSSSKPNVSFTNANADQPHKFNLLTTPAEAFTYHEPTLLFGFDKTLNSPIPSLQVIPLTRPQSPKTTNPTRNTDYFSFFSPTIPMITPQKPLTTATPTIPTTRFKTNSVFLSKSNRPTSPTYTKEPLPLQTPVTTITYFMPIEEIPQDFPKTDSQTTVFTVRAPEVTTTEKSSDIPTTGTKQGTSNNYIPLSSKVNTSRNGFAMKNYNFAKSSSTKSTSTPFISKQEKTTRSKSIYLSNKNYSSRKTTLSSSPTSSATTSAVFISNRNKENTLTSPTTRNEFSTPTIMIPTTKTTITDDLLTSTNTKSSLSPTPSITSQSTRTLFLSNPATNTNSITTNTTPLSSTTPFTTFTTTETTLNTETKINTRTEDPEILITPRNNNNVFTSTAATNDENETTTKSTLLNGNNPRLLTEDEKTTTILRGNLVKFNTKLPSTKSTFSTTNKVRSTKTTTKTLTSVRNNDDDLDIFDSNDGNVYTNKPQSSTTTRQLEKLKDEGDFLFGSFETKNSTIENTPKIIYSNFYKPSTSPSTILDSLRSTSADTTNKVTDEPSPKTSLSYQTSISYEVNRSNTTRALQTTIQFDPTIKAKVKELPNDGSLKIYKAELPDDPTNKTATKRASNEDLDLLALSLVNHARTIKILSNSTTKMPKYKRKSFSTRIKYTRKRKL